MKMNYTFKKGKKVVFTCRCNLDNELCLVDDNLISIGKCKDTFVTYRDAPEIKKDPEKELQKQIKHKNICKYAIMFKGDKNNEKEKTKEKH